MRLRRLRRRPVAGGGGLPGSWASKTRVLSFMGISVVKTAPVDAVDIFPDRGDYWWLSRSADFQTRHQALHGVGDLAHRTLEDLTVVLGRLGEAGHLADELPGGGLDVLGGGDLGAFPQALDRSARSVSSVCSSVSTCRPDTNRRLGQAEPYIRRGVMWTGVTCCGGTCPRRRRGTG